MNLEQRYFWWKFYGLSRLAIYGSHPINLIDDPRLLDDAAKGMPLVGLFSPDKRYMVYPGDNSPSPDIRTKGIMRPPKINFPPTFWQDHGIH